MTKSQHHGHRAYGGAGHICLVGVLGSHISHTSGARFLGVILKEGLEDNSHDEDTVLMGS